MPTLATIDYAAAVQLPPPSGWLFRWSVALSAIAGGVGALILLTFMLTEWTWLTGAGVIWLGIGGGIAFLALLLGSSYAITALGRRFPPPATRARAALAALAPLATGPVAFGCAVVGVFWAERVASTVEVANHSGAAIDAVEVVDDAGSQSFGPLPAGRSHRARVGTDSGSLSIVLTRGGVARTYVVDEYHVVVPGGEPRRVILDAAGVVRRLDGLRDPSPDILAPTTGPATEPVPPR